MYQLSDYDYDLPEALIAQEPIPGRSGSRLLSVDRLSGKPSHKNFTDIYNLLEPSDLIIVNNTEVIPGRLFGVKETGGRVELLILDYTTGVKKLQETGSFRCNCLIKASKRPKNNTCITFETGLVARVMDFANGVYDMAFSGGGGVDETLQKIGRMPLPPYIARNDEKAPCDDKKTYQTVYASQKGAIAAPTAGLHFTDDLIKKLDSKGIKTAPITLHVGYGTFLPVRVDDIRDHKMHSEWFSIPKETAAAINRTKKNGGRVVAVGTTSVRTLEYASGTDGTIKPLSGSCDIFIYPGYDFKLVDAMITNFHLPNSTLLMLVSAFAGRDNILNAYSDAIKNQYRFFSYGDAMFIG